MHRLPRVPRPVILTTDCGADMDDQWTLAHLALSPEIDLRGVIGGHAPNLPKPAAEFAVRTCRDVLRHLPVKTHFPIYVGASEPLASLTAPRPNAGVDFLLRGSRRFNRAKRLAVLVIGTATDVASALLLDPTLARCIEIVAMGFDGPDGGDPWNVKNDPKAWQIVPDIEAPVTLGDAKVTGRDLNLTPAQSHAMLAGCGKAGRYLADLHADRVKKHPDLTQGKQWPV